MILDRGPAGPLSDHLDAVVTGQTAPSSGLDPALAETVQRFFAADDAPAPPPELADRLWLELLRDTAPLHVIPAPITFRAADSGQLNLFALPPRPRHGLVFPFLALAYLATAALVILTLAGGFLAMRATLSPIAQDERPASIPALDEIPAAVNLAQAQIIAWPADGPPFWARLQRVTLDPGTAEGVSVAHARGVGIDLFIVESGQVTIDADGPVVVTRGAADRSVAPTTTPAGKTIVLDEGDQLFVPSEVTFRRRNDSARPAWVLDFQIANVEPTYQSASLHYERLMPDRILNTVPPVPARAAIHRLRLLPGSRLLVSDLPGMQMLFVEAGTLDLIGVRAPGDLVPVTWTSIPAGRGLAHFDTTTELANRTTEPVTFLVATIAPVD